MITFKTFIAIFAFMLYGILAVKHALATLLDPQVVTTAKAITRELTLIVFTH